MAEEDPDYNWAPPSEAEMKIIRARRERDNKISQRMGDYLLKGYKMLGITCQCGTILLQDKQGTKYCIACKELDSDVDKDDPVTNPEAALAQVREQELSSQRLEAAVQDNTGQARSVDHLHQIQDTSAPAAQEVVASSRANSENACVGNPVPAANVTPVRVISLEHVDTLSILNKKLVWASRELQQTSSVEYSIQLCQLIKSCAEAISSLNRPAQ